MTQNTGTATDMDSLPEEPRTLGDLLAWIRSREEAWRDDRERADEDHFAYANGMTTAYYCTRRRLEDVLDGLTDRLGQFILHQGTLSQGVHEEVRP